MTLVEFLRARLDEDEEVARETRRFEQRVPHTERWFASHGNAITSMAPHRAVAEVDAKRRIIDEHEPSGNYVYRDDGTPACGTCGDYTVEWPCDTLKLFALPYADHPDYDPAWRP